MAGFVVVGFEMAVINLCADAPDRLAVAPRQPETGFTMIEERVPLPVKQPMHVLPQRRDPAWITAMEAVGQIDKAVAVAPAAKCGHLDTAISSRIPLARGACVGRIWRAGSGERHSRTIHHHWKRRRGKP
jgi:hypothetical protein